MIDERTLTVGELGLRLRQTLDAAFPAGVWVSGEIDGISRARSGHVYFDLVERRDDQPGSAPTAAVPVVLFRDDRQRVNRMIKRYGNAMRMENGVQVRVQAMVDFYPPRGRLQLRMTSIDPAHTLGAIAARRAAVLARLAEEGLLGRNAESVLPAVPLRVGLVTSLGSAAHADVRKVLDASGFAFVVTEVDTAVQGAEAPAEIAAALAAAARRSEVVVLARGGGSATDLAAFDHELVARAVATCPRPVITGIGHETDRSAADEAAHTACSTPTAAARAVVQRVGAGLDRLDEAAASIVRRARRSLETAARQADRAETDLGRAAPRAIVRAGYGLDESARRLANAGGRITERAEERLVVSAQRLSRAGQAALQRSESRLASSARRLGRSGLTVERRARGRLNRASARFGLACRLNLRSAAGRLDAVEARVRALDPALVLRRGWSLTRRADGRLVRSADDVAIGDSITTHLAEGSLTSTIHVRRDRRGNDSALRPGLPSRSRRDSEENPVR